jgi:asparagine synthase (glutamine-hydrolysing)
VLFEAIAADGFKVALTGDGSDEVFGGYDRFRRARGGGDLGAYVDDIGSMPAALRREVLCPDLADPPTVLDEPGFAESYARDPLGTVMAFEVAHRLPVYHLQRVDHLSATHAVEARVPFCQPAVRALARTLPGPARIGADGRVKKALTETAARRGWVPESVVRRPKQPFTFSLAENLFAEPLTSRWVHDVLLDPGAALGDVVRPGAAARLLRVAAEVRDERAAQAVWSLLVLELWLGAVRKW